MELPSAPPPADKPRSAITTAKSNGPVPIRPSEPSIAEASEILEPVRRAPTSQEADRILAPSAVTKGYEYAKDEYVALATDELKSISPKTSTEMEIIEFVHLSEIDPIYFETSYYVKPESAGEKPYALLYRSIKDTGLVALARFAMHRREHVVVIRAGITGLIAHTMFFSTEVRKNEEYRTNVGLINEKELELANTLVRSLAAKFDATKFRDSYREQLEALIAAKVQGNQLQPVQSRPRRGAPVPDIMEALQKSLSLVKKPARQAEREQSQKQRRRK